MYDIIEYFNEILGDVEKKYVTKLIKLQIVLDVFLSL